MFDLSAISPSMRIFLGIAAIFLIANLLFKGVSAVSSYAKYAPIHQLSNYVQTATDDADYVFYRLVSESNFVSLDPNSDIQLDVAFQSLEPDLPESDSLETNPVEEEKPVQLSLAELVLPYLKLSGISNSGAFLNGKYVPKGKSVKLGSVLNLQDKGLFFGGIEGGSDQDGSNSKLKIIGLSERSVTAIIDGKVVTVN